MRIQHNRMSERSFCVFVPSVYRDRNDRKKWEKAEKILNAFIISKAYDRNTRNVENFNRIIAERRK